MISVGGTAGRKIIFRSNYQIYFFLRPSEEYDAKIKRKSIEGVTQKKMADVGH